MRTLFCFCLATLFTLSLSASPMPTIDWNLTTTVAQNKMIHLKINNLNQAATRVYLTDLQEEMEYFAKRIRKHNGFSKVLDLSELPNGRYLLKVQNKSGVQQQIILIRDQMVVTSHTIK
ncbi:MAG: hypothetical protein AB8G22_09800 [Saprospiraceae bacterium]